MRLRIAYLCFPVFTRACVHWRVRDRAPRKTNVDSYDRRSERRRRRLGKVIGPDMDAARGPKFDKTVRAASREAGHSVWTCRVDCLEAALVRAHGLGAAPVLPHVEMASTRARDHAVTDRRAAE